MESGTHLGVQAGQQPRDLREENLAGFGKQGEAAAYPPHVIRKPESLVMSSWSTRAANHGYIPRLLFVVGDD